MTHETELKFQIPESKRAAVRRAVGTATSRTVTMRAVYFDTARRDLARAGLSLRLRQEGRQWIQTLKSPGLGAIDRLEHEVVFGSQSDMPELDLNRHAGTAAAALLASLPEFDLAALRPVCDTQVRRVQRLVRTAGAVLELSFDEGLIVAGERRMPLCELEFELRSGSFAGLVAMAMRWVQRYGLWLDVRSKFQRGELLSQGQRCGPAMVARAPALQESMDPDTALRCIVRSVLAQTLPHASEMAAGSGSPEHLHQLRVGLRRLRTALKVFRGWSADARPGWEFELRALFGLLGAARDRDAIEESIVPDLARAGAPCTALPHPPVQEGAVAAVQGVPCNRVLLELIAFSVGASAGPHAGSTAPLSALATPCLQRLHRRLKADAATFPGADDESRHSTRKRAKRMRYSIDFVAALYPRAPVKRYLDRLRDAQEALGEFNDSCVAEEMFRAQVAEDARAWFAVGWLVAQREARVRSASAALARLANLPKARHKHAVS